MCVLTLVYQDFSLPWVIPWSSECLIQSIFEQSIKHESKYTKCLVTKLVANHSSAPNLTIALEIEIL